MDLTQLEHFLAVVDERTFTRAAERVCRSQPAVSQSIKRLEEEVGVPLFARDVHDVCLTEAGQMLVDYARKMVRTRNEALNELEGLKRLTTGTLKIAAHESAAVYLLPAPLRYYQQCFPDIKVCIYRSRLADIPRQVLDRDVHVGFVKDEPPFHELRSVEVHSDEMVLVAPAGHPLAHRKDARLADFANERFVLHRDQRHTSSPTEQMILRLFEQHGCSCRIVAEVWSFENLKNFVQAEIGLAIVPKITVEHELHTGRLAWIRVPELNISRRTLMIYQEHGYLSDVARELIKIVQSFNWGAELRELTASCKVTPLKRQAKNR
jgi:DNA-binding transcriptional LysR family regulator